MCTSRATRLPVVSASSAVRFPSSVLRLPENVKTFFCLTFVIAGALWILWTVYDVIRLIRTERRERRHPKP